MDNMFQSNPELMKYLSGEISFDTWFQQQEIQTSQQTEIQTSQQTEQASNTSTSSFSQLLHDNIESASIFSSWGNAFTANAASNIGSSVKNTSDDESDEEEFAEDSDDDEELSIMKLSVPKENYHTDTQKISFEIKLPNFENLKEADGSEPQTVTWMDLKPIIDDLAIVLPNSTVRKESLPKGGKEHFPEEELEANSDIMKDFQDFRLRKRGRSTMKKRNKLPELLRLQMGQANLLVAKRDFKQAADICMEIIKEAPYSGQPFKTLSFIYEEQGNKEMALEYSLVYAFLDCKDGNEWLDLAKRCYDAGNSKQGLTCYNRACLYRPWDMELNWERSLKFFEAEDYRKCIDIYFLIHKRIFPANQDVYLDCAKRMTKIYHNLGLLERAAEVLQCSFEVCSNTNDYEAVNLLSEMLLESKQYDEVIQTIVRQCNVVLPSAVMENITDIGVRDPNLETMNQFIQKSLRGANIQQQTATIAQKAAQEMATNINSAESLNILHGSNSPVGMISTPPKQYATLSAKPPEQTKYIIPDELPLELRVKMAQCLIYCKEYKEIDTVVSPIFSEDINEVGDLVFDIGEAFYEAGLYEEALRYVLEVVSSEKYNQAGVWLKLAEIYHHLGQMDQSIDAYYQVLALAPLQVSVRLALVTALNTVGRHDEAETVLSDYDGALAEKQGEEFEPLSESNRLKIEEYEEWYNKCQDMYANQQFKDLISYGYILLHNYLMSTYGYQKKQTVSRVQMWDMLRKILNKCVDLKEFHKGATLLEQAIVYKPYGESRKYRLELDYLLTTMYFVAGEYSKAFDAFRVLISHEREDKINTVQFWNLFVQIVNKMMDKRHHRFSLRLLFKRPNIVPLVIQNGNNSHISGTYKYAIGEFSRAFRACPTDPLNSLLLGVAYLHLSMQKFHKTRHASCLHGIVFMFQYFYLRGETQEAYYNLARSFHQIGLVHIAVIYYNKALSFPLYNENKQSSSADYHPFVDLHREAAYNLSRIYEQSGNRALARSIMHKYCWV